MALGKYVITATTTVPAGTPATVTAGDPQTGGAAGYGSAAVTSGQLWPVMFLVGTPIILDTASAFYASLNGAGALRPFVDGQDTVSHQAISN
jgi:hypothetical protein